MKLFSRWFLPIIFSSLFLFSGCDTAVITNGNILGIQSGKFVYENGYLQANYPYPLDKVWQACERTIQDLNASGIDKRRKISSGKITAKLYEDKIIIDVEYVGRDSTNVSILAGISGNQLAARLIHEKIIKSLTGGTESLH